MEETIEKCAVPFCKGTTRLAKVRIQLPIDYATQQLWWQMLAVEHKEYTTNAVLCTKHFNFEEDLAAPDQEYYLKNNKSEQAMRLRVAPNIVSFRHVPYLKRAPLKLNVKHCMVKSCGNNSINAPNKIFILLPKNKERKDEWIRSTECNYYRYCCEDHFNLETDMENYMHYKMMGSRMRFKKGVVPHIFKPKATEFADCGRTEKGNNALNNRQSPVLASRIVKSECVLPNFDDIKIRADADSYITNVKRSPDESGVASARCDVKNEVQSDNEQVDDNDVHDECSNEVVDRPLRDVKNEIFLNEIRIEDVDDRLTPNRGEFKKATDKSKAMMSAIKAQLQKNPKVTIHPIVGPCKFDLKLPPGSSLADNFTKRSEPRSEQSSNRSHDESLFASQKVKDIASSGAALSAVKAELVKWNPNVIIHPVVGPCKVAPSAGSAGHEISKEKSEMLHRTVDDTSLNRGSNVEKTFNSSKSGKSCTVLTAVKAQLVKRNPKVIIHPVIGPCKVALVLPSRGSEFL